MFNVISCIWCIFPTAMIYDETSASETKWWFGDFYQLPACLDLNCLFASGSQWPFVNILPRWGGGQITRFFQELVVEMGFWRFLLCFFFVFLNTFCFPSPLDDLWWFIVCFWDVFLFSTTWMVFLSPFVAGIIPFLWAWRRLLNWCR